MKILLIEDEPNVISFVRRGLIEAEHEVSVAMDGITGLEMIYASPPDIILLDIMLPGINGIDLCRKVRSQKISVPIIMLTALGSSDQQHVTKKVQVVFTILIVGRGNNKLSWPLRVVHHSIIMLKAYADLGVARILQTGNKFR